MTEAQLQSQIVQALRLAGVRVLVTSRQRRRCPRCGTWPRGGDGVTKGLPDLLVWRPGWGLRLLGLEVKGDDTRIRPEQRELADLGAIQICRTLEEALAIADVTNLEVKG